MRVVVFLAILYKIHAFLSCLNDAGVAVDHWTGIKGNNNDTMYYYDDTTDLFKLSKYTVSQTVQGAIMATIAPLYDVPGNRSMAYVLYNDAPPGDYNPSSTYAHSKGILVTDGTQGFWLTHSMPNWPDSPLLNNTPGIFPSYKYAQSMACVTLSAASVNQAANTMRINYPYIYASNMPSNLEKQQNWMHALISKTHITNLTASNDLTSLGGVPYIQFAKSKAWNMDLWDDLVAPYYKTPMYVETWISGSGGAMSSICAVNSSFPDKKSNEAYDIYEVARIQMPDGNDWDNTQDHSKWGIAKATEIGNPTVFHSTVACIGDINRMCSQEKRGGGALCTQNAGLLNAFVDIIAGVEPCYLKDPCAGSGGSKCYWCPITPPPSPTPAPASAPTPTAPSDQGSYLFNLSDPKEYIGVIVGIALSALLLIGGIYYYQRRQRRKAGTLASKDHLTGSTEDGDFSRSKSLEVDPHGARSPVK